MEFNESQDSTTAASTSSPNETNDFPENNTSRLIAAITDFIPAFFSPNGVLKENENENKPNTLEAIIQSEEFFSSHPNSYQDDETKNAFVINKLRGTARKWGLSLLTDGTLKTLSFKQFKKLLLENFDAGEERKQKYVIMDELWKLRQHQLGNVAEYTIEFRRLAGRLGWPDEVLVDIIGKGLIDRVREEYDKQEKPKSLFEATNIIIGIDKKCYLESRIRHKSNNNRNYHNKSQKRKQDSNKFRNQSNYHKNNNKKPKKDILSANYTPSGTQTMTTMFLIKLNGRDIRANMLIDSGSARSFLCKNFTNANKIPTMGLTTPINIQLPNSKSMNIKQTTNPLNLKIMDHNETFEFCVGNLLLNGINGILGRDCLAKHNPYIDYGKNKIFFIGRHCGSHCLSARKNKFIVNHSEVTAPMVISNKQDEEQPTDSIIPDSISEDDLYDPEPDVLATMLPEFSNKLPSKEEIIRKYYFDLKEVFEKKNAEKLPPHRDYDISLDLIPGRPTVFWSYILPNSYRVKNIKRVIIVRNYF